MPVRPRASLLTSPTERPDTICMCRTADGILVDASDEAVIDFILLHSIKACDASLPLLPIILTVTWLFTCIIGFAALSLTLRRFLVLAPSSIVRGAPSAAESRWPSSSRIISRGGSSPGPALRPWPMTSPREMTSPRDTSEEES